MERKRLLHSLLAISYDILSSCSHEQLEQALDHFKKGAGIRLEPYEAVDLKEYDFLIEKIKRAFAYRKKPAPKPKPKEEAKPSDYPNLFTVTVPMEMDVSKLSDLERQILYQNLDKMLLVTMHPPLTRTKERAKVRAKIGIAVRHLWPEQKQALGIKEDNIKEEAVGFYKDDVRMASIVFMPILHHFYKILCARINVFGVPP